MTGISLPHIMEMAGNTTRLIHTRFSDSLSSLIRHIRPDVSQLEARIEHLERSRLEERSLHQQELASLRAKYEVQKLAASRFAAELLALKSKLALTSGSSFTDPISGLLTIRGAAEELIVAVSTLWHASWVASSHDRIKQLPCSVVLFDLSWIVGGEHGITTKDCATILREAFSRRSDIIFRPPETDNALCIIMMHPPKMQSISSRADGYINRLAIRFNHPMPTTTHPHFGIASMNIHSATGGLKTEDIVRRITNTVDMANGIMHLTRFG